MSSELGRSGIRQLGGWLFAVLRERGQLVILRRVTLASTSRRKK